MTADEQLRHDLRNQIQIIMLSIAWLMAHEPIESLCHQTVRTILDSTARMLARLDAA